VITVPLTACQNLGFELGVVNGMQWERKYGGCVLRKTGMMGGRLFHFSFLILRVGA